MLAVDFLQLMPGFETGASTLHNILIGVTLVLSFCGLLLLVSQGLREKSTHNILPTLVRLAVIVIMVGSLGAWGNLLVDGVNDVVAQMGLNGALAEIGARANEVAHRVAIKAQQINAGQQVYSASQAEQRAAAAYKGIDTDLQALPADNFREMHLWSGR